MEQKIGKNGNKQNNKYKRDKLSSMLKILVLDLHGILIKKFPKARYVRRLKKLLASKGYNDDDYYKLKKQYGTISFGAHKEGFREEYLRMLDGLTPFEYVDEELLELLRNVRLKMYIATDTSFSNCLDSLIAAGMYIAMFDGVISGDDVKIPKPHSEIYKIILKQSKVKPEEVLVIGDRLTDIIPATELGINGLVCNYDIFKEVLKWMNAKGKISVEDLKENHSIKNK